MRPAMSGSEHFVLRKPQSGSHRSGRPQAGPHDIRTDIASLDSQSKLFGLMHEKTIAAGQNMLSPEIRSSLINAYEPRFTLKGRFILAINCF